MAKKRHPGASGWPHGGAASARHGQLEVIQRLAARFATGGVVDADFDRYSERLNRMLRDWREFRHIRPDMAALQRALRSLPESEFRALLDPSSGQRRSRRARARVFQLAFDVEIAELLAPALADAAQRAGSPDDAGALALAVHSLRGWSDGSVPPEANPLLAILLDVSFDDFHELGKALQEVEALMAQEPAEAAEDPERQKRVQEAIAKHPAFQRDAERRAFRLGNRLLHYVERGVVRAHIPAEELAALTRELAQLARGIAARSQEADAPDASADIRASTPDLVARIRGFANDPANDALFRKFTEDLAAEAQEAAAKGLPLAERLAPLVDFCQVAGEPASPIRTIICQASLARARADAESEQAGGEAPPA
ncbi:MAG TPA: hypothetical protein VNE39_07460 [Planctomycetota bacterium]|nr:hypothetical protein [Planctomycetota bacterium]